MIGSLFPALLSLFTLVAQAPAAPAPPTMEQVRARLRAYEARMARGEKQDPAALGEIARMDLDRALASRTFDVWSQACGSEFVADKSACDARLLGVMRQKTAPLRERSAAAAALLRRGHKDVAAEYLALVKALPVGQLAGIAEDLRALPERDAVPLLIRVLESPDAAHQSAACRALGHIDALEVRPALDRAVGRAMPGLQTWNVCMLARARLREPDAVLALSGFSRAMQGEDLLDAAIAMVEVGNEHGDFMLRRVTREVPGVVRLRAAEHLAESDPGYATQYVAPALGDSNPLVRAEALVLERQLKRDPSAAIRAMLVDPDELVRLRAATAILDWVRRQQAPSR